jgi:short-subunit dehydrogenase
MALPAPGPKSTAVVTGASSGIGEQLARQLAGRGHNVVLIARSEDVLTRLAEELSSEHGVQADVVAADLADEAARERAVGMVERLELDVEILVNSAGFGVYEPFAESDHAREMEQVRLLVDAPTDLTHRWLPAMVARKRGAIINLSSTAGFQPLPYNAGYAAAKAHTLLLSEALHTEVKEFGVTVTAVCPGPVKSGFQAASDAGFADKLPKATWVPADRVAAKALKAADKGKRSVVPGGLHVKLFFGPNRYMPTPLVLAVSKRLMKA